MNAIQLAVALKQRIEPLLTDYDKPQFKIETKIISAGHTSAETTCFPDEERGITLEFRLNQNHLVDLLLFRKNSKIGLAFNPTREGLRFLTGKLVEPRQNYFIDFDFEHPDYPHVLTYVQLYFEKTTRLFAQLHDERQLLKKLMNDLKDHLQKEGLITSAREIPLNNERMMYKMEYITSTGAIYQGFFSADCAVEGNPDQIVVLLEKKGEQSVLLNLALDEVNCSNAAAYLEAMKKNLPNELHKGTQQAIA